MSLFKEIRKFVHEEDEEIRIERREEKELHKIEELLEELVDQNKPKMRVVKIAFGDGEKQMIGPLTINIGQQSTVSVFGFDQNGQPMPASFVMPPVTLEIDNPALDSLVPITDTNTALLTSLTAPTGANVANVRASVTSAEGLALQDIETVTNVAPVGPPVPVLSSIKVDFSTPVIPPPPVITAAPVEAPKP